MYIGLHVERPLFLYDFNETRIFLTYCRKNPVSNFMKIRPVGVELFHAEGRTDMRKLVVAFRNFAKAPNNALFISQKLALYLFIYINVLRTRTQLQNSGAAVKNWMEWRIAKIELTVRWTKCRREEQDSKTCLEVQLQWNGMSTIEYAKCSRERAEDLRNWQTTDAGV